MRTTVTLDPDVERLLRDAVRRSGRSFKEILNRAVREGLRPRFSQGSSKFRVEARAMGLRPGLDVGALNRLLDELEVEAFTESPPRHR